MSENIQDRIHQEIEVAREACDVSGSNSEKCAAAWDVVEELQAEASHQREKGSDKNSFEAYCDSNPEADECRVYDN
ncbi:MAG: Calvin cycle protein CP12 [Nodosilinea sp.]